jgi:hypothetical protein
MIKGPVKGASRYEENGFVERLKAKRHKLDKYSKMPKNRVVGILQYYTRVRLLHGERRRSKRGTARSVPFTGAENEKSKRTIPLVNYESRYFIRHHLLGVFVAGVVVKTTRELKPQKYHSVKLDTAPLTPKFRPARRIVDACRAELHSRKSNGEEE